MLSFLNLAGFLCIEKYSEHFFIEEIHLVKKRIIFVIDSEFFQKHSEVHIDAPSLYALGFDRTPVLVIFESVRLFYEVEYLLEITDELERTAVPLIHRPSEDKCIVWQDDSESWIGVDDVAMWKIRFFKLVIELRCR